MGVMRVITPIFFLIFILASCAKFDKEQMQARVLPKVEIEKTEKSAFLQDSLFVKGEFPEKNFWTDFCDDRLNDLVEKALKNSPNLKAVESRLNASKAHADKVKSKIFPKIDALFNLLWAYLTNDFKKRFPTLDTNFQFYTLGFDFNYDFDFWGVNRKQFRAMLGEVEATRADYEHAKMALIVSIVNSYFNLQACYAKCVITDEILKNRQKINELEKIRDKFRIGNTILVKESDSLVLELFENLSVLKQELEVQKSCFLTLLGENPSNDLSFDLKWEPNFFRFELPSNIGLNLLARRPDLKAHVCRIKKSSESIGVAVSQFYPSINLKGLLPLENFSFDTLFSEKSFMPSLFPLIQLPIFHGGALRSNLREKIAQHEVNIFEYNSALLTATNEVVVGINKLKAVDERLNFQREKMFLSQKIQELTEIKYLKGIDSLMNLVWIRQNHLFNELYFIEMQRVKLNSILALVKALGGGYVSE
jgi:NodT family efflux transporter outer membrane factor (OMF) lipoprotein